MVKLIIKKILLVILFNSTFGFSQSYNSKLEGKSFSELTRITENQIYSSESKKCKISIVTLNDLQSHYYKSFAYIQNFKQENYSIIAIGKYYFNDRNPFFVILEVFIYDKKEDKIHSTNNVYGEYKLTFDLNSLNKDFKKKRIYNKKLIKKDKYKEPLKR